uniref:Uncharacterized protein n=1 Tax=Panagrellus redivivus TaxID=6233 RepID=A0A7E4W8H8_PANRE
MNHEDLLDRRLCQAVSATVSSVLSSGQFFRTGQAPVASDLCHSLLLCNANIWPSSPPAPSFCRFEPFLATHTPQNWSCVDRMNVFDHIFEA